MSRADKARREAEEDEADRLAHERPNIPPEPFDGRHAWEGFCAGNRTNRHGWPSDKTATHWRCGSCGLWLHAPERTQQCDHDFRHGGAICRRCGAVQ